MISGRRTNLRRMWVQTHSCLISSCHIISSSPKLWFLCSVLSGLVWEVLDLQRKWECSALAAGRMKFGMKIVSSLQVRWFLQHFIVSLSTVVPWILYTLCRKQRAEYSTSTSQICFLFPTIILLNGEKQRSNLYPRPLSFFQHKTVF